MILTVPTRPRNVTCLIEHEHRDLAVAEAIVAGRFTINGLTLVLGVEPDWHSPRLPDDVEWRIEWSKFYFGLDLAHAHRMTGDHRFLRTWERLVASWVRQVPVDFDASDVVARRVQNWVYAWNLFADTPGFDGFADGLVETLMESIAAQVRQVRDHLTAERNHRTLELYALFIAALALPELDEGGDLLAFATTELCQNLLDDVLADGVHREASTHYHHIALRTYLGARENARRFGVQFPGAYDERLARACEFALHSHRPDGSIPAVSDSDSGSYLDLLEMAAELLGREDFRYGASGGQHGAPPAARYASFPVGGYYVQRSGWGCNATPFQHERHLMLDCGPLGDGGHGHYDLLSVEIAAHGRPLIVDPGRYTYAEGEPNWRHWFKGTAAHNTVCVDGLDQTPYRRHRPKGPVARGRLIERQTGPGLDLLHGEVTSPVYDAIHRRRVLFVGDEYWIIADELEANEAHRYDLRFHLAPDANERTAVQVGPDQRRSSALAVRAPGLALVFVADGVPRIESGWVSPLYGVKLPAPVVSVAVDGVSRTRFLTLVAPLADEAAGPPRLRAIRADDGGPTLIEVDGVGPGGADRDLLAWSPGPERHDLDALQCRASVAWLRRSRSGGDWRTFVGCQVSTLTSRDGRLISASSCFGVSDMPVSWVRWDADRGLSRSAQRGRP